MDITVTTNSIITGTTIETPRRVQSAKIIPFANGCVKHENALVGGGVRYTECLKNHAASLGSHALDGCGEFMPAPTAVASDPTSLKCAACGCHRNFHRQELQQHPQQQRVIEYHPQHRHHPLPPRGLVEIPPPAHALAARQVRSPGSDDESPPPISSTYYPVSAPHTLLAMSSRGGAVITNNNGNNNNNNSSSLQILNQKRFRTKFSQEQKEKMQEFAEKIEWKMVKSSEDLINEFCNKIGVQRGVFKVWMHNNKSTIGKSPRCESTNYIISDNNNNNLKLINNNNNNSHTISLHQHSNASSSSS